MLAPFLTAEVPDELEGVQVPEASTHDEQYQPHHVIPWNNTRHRGSVAEDEAGGAESGIGRQVNL